MQKSSLATHIVVATKQILGDNIMSKRNIVLITLDSLRADHCSFMGYHRETTPTMDKMARKGLVFENAIAASVPTAPSMFCCFTGEYPLINSLDLSPKNWRNEFIGKNTLAQVLSKKGYYTVAFHSNPWVSDIYGFTKGFNLYEDAIAGDKDRLELMDPSSKLSKWLRRIEVIRRKHPSTMPWESYYPRLIQFIDKLKEPFFLWILLYDTHTLYLPPKKYIMYGPKNTLSLIYLFYLYWKAYSKKNLKVENKNIINAYDDAIHYADLFIKRFWKDVKDKDPIIIVHADHGDGLGEHGFYWHPPLLYEELIHVPFVIYNADIKGRVKKPVSLLGLAPTILELLGYNEQLFPSRSFLNNGDKIVVSKVVENYQERVAIRTEEWKYIYGQKKGGELYNIKEDPREQNNLIADYPKLSKEFEKIAKIIIKHDTEKIALRKKIRQLGRKII